MRYRQTGLGSHRFFWMLILLNAVFYFVLQLPGMNVLMLPLDTFVTTLHEFGHASTCVLTGGDVNSLTIVSNGKGAAGVTSCSGGWMFLVTQAGYLGAAFFGCILVWLGTEAKSSKVVLQLLAGVFLAISIMFVAPGILYGKHPGQSLESLPIALAIAAALFFAGIKMSEGAARITLLILGGQTALNALNSVFGLIRVWLGLAYIPGGHRGDFGDATMMSEDYFMPASFWILAWAAIAMAMLAFTLWHCFRQAPDSD